MIEETDKGNRILSRNRYCDHNLLLLEYKLKFKGEHKS